MKKIKFILIFLAVIGAAFSVFWMLNHEKALLTHPQGVIAEKEFGLIKTNLLLMLIVVVPTFLFLLIAVWKQRRKGKTPYDPERPHGRFQEILLWIIPSVVVVVMAVITWRATHELDPYKPLESSIKPLTIQVVALDWKWLFIYPEQGIATLNFVHFPERTPIRFELAADGSPMNSFWIPELSGQIYAMSGMMTQLHLMANGPGTYAGRAAEINGRGYADMLFVAQSSSQEDFDHWVASVKASPLRLTDAVYEEFLKPSQNDPIVLYSYVENGLFNRIVMKYMYHCHPKP
jgi:cytochrome o ubiquinol oxidase subunit II